MPLAHHPQSCAHRPGLPLGSRARGRAPRTVSRVCCVPSPSLAERGVRGAGGGTVPRGAGPGVVAWPCGWGEPAATPPSPASQWRPRLRAGIGAGVGLASAVSAVIREGKVPCAESRAGARSYGGRSGRAGPTGAGGGGGRTPERDLASLGVSLRPHHRPGAPRTFARSHGRRRGARRGVGASGGARAARGASAHLPLGANPPARPAGRQVAGH
jgi:hypothetical protein